MLINPPFGSDWPQRLPRESRRHWFCLKFSAGQATVAVVFCDSVSPLPDPHEEA